jgi:hypothetical protein
MIQTKLSGGTHWLEPVAAASFERCLAAGAPNAIESAGRTWEAQQALLKRYGYPRAELPARSFHVKGQAIDAQAPLIAWFVAHPEHGWRRTVTAEPWHFQYFPHLDTQEDDMAFSADQLQQIAANGVAQALMGPQSQALIRKIVWDETMVLRGPDVSVKQDLANTGTMARDILAAVQSASAPVIDYDALAAKIPAPKIDYAALAKAVNDDAARRMQG